MPFTPWTLNLASPATKVASDQVALNPQVPICSCRGRHPGEAAPLPWGQSPMRSKLAGWIISKLCGIVMGRMYVARDMWAKLLVDPGRLPAKS